MFANVPFAPDARPERHVFAHLTATASVVFDVVDVNGVTIETVTATVTTTPQTFFDLMQSYATGGWSTAMVGARLLSTSDDVYWNTSGVLDVLAEDGQGRPVQWASSVGEAPTSASGKVAAGSYATGPYKMGQVA